jgi:hypothetical protein
LGKKTQSLELKTQMFKTNQGENHE